MEKKIIQSIDRALQIIELFSLEKYEWGITEISKALNIYKSNIYNVLITLAGRGFIVKDSKTDKYKLGIKFFELGSVVIKNMDLIKTTRPYIEKIFNEFKETVHLGVLDDGRVVSVEREESDEGLCSHIEIGKRTPLHSTAVGKAIMAYLSENEINLIIKEKGLTKFTENTIITEKDLEKEFKKIRKQGYAIDNMETQKGVLCIASPIRNYSGRVFASMSVSGPAFRIDKDKITKKIIRYCSLISKEMGYIPKLI